jgi:hypothetical protein
VTPVSYLIANGSQLRSGAAHAVGATIIAVIGAVILLIGAAVRRFTGRRTNHEPAR